MAQKPPYKTVLENKITPVSGDNSAHQKALDLLDAHIEGKIVPPKPPLPGDEQKIERQIIRGMDLGL